MQLAFIEKDLELFGLNLYLNEFLDVLFKYLYPLCPLDIPVIFIRKRVIKK